MILNVPVFLLIDSFTQQFAEVGFYNLALHFPVKALNPTCIYRRVLCGNKAHKYNKNHVLFTDFQESNLKCNKIVICFTIACNPFVTLKIHWSW